MAGKGGISNIAKGRSDTYRLSPSDLHVKDGWNCRDLDSTEAQKELEELAASIAEIGVKQPLTVYWEDGKAFVTDGHRRRLASLMVLEKQPDLVVPVITESRYADEAERVFSQIIRNAGKPLTPLEQGMVFKRLVDLDWTDAEIARRAGVSRVHVANLKALVDAPKPLVNMVRSGKVSSTLAIKTLKQHKGDGKAAVEELKQATKTAKAEGKARATAKHVQPKAAKPQPQAPKITIDIDLKKLVADVFERTSTTDGPADGIILAHFAEKDFNAIREACGLVTSRDADLV